ITARVPLDGSRCHGALVRRCCYVLQCRGNKRVTSQLVKHFQACRAAVSDCTALVGAMVPPYEMRTIIRYELDTTHNQSNPQVPIFAGVDRLIKQVEGI